MGDPSSISGGSDISKMSFADRVTHGAEAMSKAGVNFSTNTLLISKEQFLNKLVEKNEGKMPADELRQYGGDVYDAFKKNLENWFFNMYTQNKQAHEQAKQQRKEMENR